MVATECLFLKEISAHTALRLARYFGTSERFWLIFRRSSTQTDARELVADAAGAT